MPLDLGSGGGLAVTGIGLMQLGGNGGASRRRFPSRCIRRRLMSPAGVQGDGVEIAGFQVWTQGGDSEAGSVSSFSSSEASVKLETGTRK